MTVQRQAVPEACLRVLKRALEEMLRESPPSSTPVTEQAQVGSPIPRLDWSPHSLRKQAPRREWLFPLVGGSELAFAVMVDANGNDHWSFVGFRTGAFATRLFDACAIAEESVEPSGSVYEPRLVELHELYFAALWLFAPRGDVFVSLLDGVPKGSGELLVGHDLERTLLERAATRERRFAHTTGE